MEFGKKQWIIGGAVALVLAGGSAGVVAYNHTQAQEEKIALEAKIARDNQINEAKNATEKAETFQNEADVKTAQEAIKKLEEKDKAGLIARVETVEKNWDFVNNANKSVLSAEKAITDATVKTAQADIDKLKMEMTKSKKVDLQRRLDKVKATIKEKQVKAKEKEKEKAQAEAAQKAKEQAKVAQSSEAITPSAQTDVPAQADTSSGASEQSAPVQNSQSYAAATAPNTGGVAVAPSTPSGNTGNPSYNNGGGANANPNQSLDDMDSYNRPSNGENSIDGGR
ncbi:serine protease [Lactococcus garvieae]|uniref:serine protease n=1 Tax=Lactococcus garvieae TaxID=1363 RepID=UPI003851CD07